MTTNWPGSVDTLDSLRPPGEAVTNAQQMLRNVAAAVVAIEQSLVNGGTPLDSLTLADFIAIGAAAASAGAVRLSQDGAIASRNVADDGDVELAKATSYVSGMTNYDIALLAGSMVVDPAAGAVNFLAPNASIVVSNSAVAAYDGSNVFSVQHAAIYEDSLLISKADGSELIDIAEASGASFVVLRSLPVADPVLAGRLWNDAGTLKVSAG